MTVSVVRPEEIHLQHARVLERVHVVLSYDDRILATIG